MAINFLNFKAGTTNYSSNSSVNYKQYNPQEALQKYMQANNCDEATAKSALQQMYGAPQQNDVQGVQGGTSSSGINGNSLNGSTNGIVNFNQGSNPKEDFDNQLLMLGIPKNIVQTHNQNTIKEYADENNIQLPNPPQHGQKLDFMG